MRYLSVPEYCSYVRVDIGMYISRDIYYTYLCKNCSATGNMLNEFEMFLDVDICICKN